ncbi:glycosyltransferase family protein [Pseudomonas putida]
MKVLFLVQKEQRIILDRLYQAVAEHCECDLRWLDSAEQRDLRGYFRREVDVSQYDRILFFLRFKQEIRQVSFIRTVPNLVILEHDAYQNYIDCKYTGKFSRHYRSIPWARVITSGYQVTRRLQQEGFDATFVAKGYDQTLLRDLGGERDIELAFVGSTGSVAYSGRKALLEELAARENLLVTRTKSGDDYLNTLNRIRFFVGADVGMGEYMIKNFEAMACGCVLLAYDQGEAENRALGFVDMHNLVLYTSVSQLQEKLAQLRADPQLASRIASNGMELARSQYSFARIGQQIVEAMGAPLRPAQLRSPLGEGWLRIRRALMG